MTSYQITPAGTGITIRLTEVGDKQQQLLTAFGQCQTGQCSCPTAEYEKVAAMDVTPSKDAIAITLQATPGARFDPDQIAACLEYTVEQVGAEPRASLDPPSGDR